MGHKEKQKENIRDLVLLKSRTVASCAPFFKCVHVVNLPALVDLDVILYILMGQLTQWMDEQYNLY